VTDHNIEILRKAVRNGVEVHPGANFIVSGSSTGAGAGFKKFLKFGDREAAAAQLRIGDIVERHLRDDEFVSFLHLSCIIQE
jgi:DNA-directed RNA polymerase III subunit RPC1